MNPRLGKLVLGLSAAGYSLTQLAIRRFGRRGAVVAAAVCAGLAVRDAAMVAAGAPGRLRPGPALLLWLELVAAVGAAGLGFRLALDEDAVERARADPGLGELARRGAFATLFGLHTLRFWI